MTSIPGDALIVRRDRVVANDLSATETVMLDVDRGTYFGLKDVAAAIWADLAQPTTLDALCARLVERFEVDETTCRREVAEFLADLADQELIDVRPGPPGA